MVDALIPDWRLVLEADGRRYHQRIEDFERDRWRDAEAAVHGLHVMRFTHRRLRDDRAGITDQIVRYGRRMGRRAA
jgi:very-short-patch-repair endonuclease